jgi:methionyl-tRNA formyltransferase
MQIDVLIDNNNSFLNSYKKKIKKIICKRFKYRFFNKPTKLKKGDILFLLGCQKILKDNKLKYHKLNIVLHPSKLPKGKGHASLFHEILKSKKFFFITMFNANSKVDAGDIIMVKKFYLKGHELHDEIRGVQGNLIMQMISEFIKKYPKIRFIKQKGSCLRRCYHLVQQ